MTTSATDMPALGGLATPAGDPDASGCSVTSFDIPVHDCIALEAFLASNLPSFTYLFYYPDVPRLLVQTAGTEVDTSAVQQVVNAYGNPLPNTATLQTVAMAPIQCNSTFWKNVFIFPVSPLSGHKLTQCVVSCALGRADTTFKGQEQEQEKEGTVRIVAQEADRILGSISISGLHFQDYTVALADVLLPSTLELQMQTSSSAYITLNGLTLTFMPNA